MTNRIVNPREFYPNIPIGAGQLPGAVPHVDAPSQVQSQAAPQRYNTAVSLIDGNNQTLAQISLPEPREIGAMLCAPLAAQDLFVQAHGIILGGLAFGAALRELWILGTAQIGTGGVVREVSFDIPLDQLVQFSCVAQTLKISARLYVKLLSSNLGYSRAMFSSPPTYQGTTIPTDGVGGVGSPQKIALQCVAGDGVKSGASNLSRRQQTFGVLTGGSDTVVPPTNATSWRVLAPTGTTCVPHGQTLLAAAPGFQDVSYGAVPADAQPRPMPDNMSKLVINNLTGADGFNAETVWSIGVSNKLGD